MKDETKNFIVKQTLDYLDKPFSKWITFNSRLNTSIIENYNEMKSNIELRVNELPILECINNSNLVLITSERVISRLNDQLCEMNIIDFKKFSNKLEKLNYQKNDDGKYPKTNRILIELNNKSNDGFIFEIDSFYPAQFSKLLISNIYHYLKYGTLKWGRVKKV